MAAVLTTEETLSSLGLSPNEAKIILTLLKSGLSTITAIAKNSGLYRANVYETVEKLKAKNLVNYVKKEEKVYLQAADPTNLLNLIKDKELALQQILPQLRLDYQLCTKHSPIEICEGVAAIRNLMKHYVEKKETIYDFGVPRIAIELVGKWSQNAIHKQRAKQKQWMYHIYNSDAKKRIEFLNKLPYTHARYLSPEFDSPVTTRICGDEVSITLYSENPTTIIVKNEQMAKAYQKYFEILWERAKEEL